MFDVRYMFDGFIRSCAQHPGGIMLQSIVLPVLDVAHAVLDLAPLLRRHLPLVERGQEVGRGLLGVVDQPPVGDDLVVEGLGPVQLQWGVSLVRLRVSEPDLIPILAPLIEST